jgi:hypothetical protein
MTECVACGADISFDPYQVFGPAGAFHLLCFFRENPELLPQPETVPRGGP